MGNSFHQTAVANKYVSVMIDNIKTGPVEIRGKYFFRQRHAYRIRETLPQRAGSGFHSRRVTILGMAGRFGMKLAETLDFLHRQIVAGEVQQGINQHRAMTIRQHKTVAVHPFRIDGIVAQMMNP